MKETRISSSELAGEEGFEPSHRDPESRVLPLDDSPKTDATESGGAIAPVRAAARAINRYTDYDAPLQSKSGPIAGLLNGIIPLNLPLYFRGSMPQKTAGIVKLLQSQLYNPPNTPIISPHPTDINTPANAPHFRHGSLAPAFFFPIYRLIQRCLRPSPFLFRSGRIQFEGGDGHAN